MSQANPQDEERLARRKATEALPPVDARTVARVLWDQLVDLHGDRMTTSRGMAGLVREAATIALMGQDRWDMDDLGGCASGDLAAGVQAVLDRLADERVVPPGLRARGSRSRSSPGNPFGLPYCWIGTHGEHATWRLLHLLTGGARAPVTEAMDAFSILLPFMDGRTGEDVAAIGEWLESHGGPHATLPEPYWTPFREAVARSMGRRLAQRTRRWSNPQDEERLARRTGGGLPRRWEDVRGLVHVVRRAVWIGTDVFGTLPVGVDDQVLDHVDGEPCHPVIYLEPSTMEPRPDAFWWGCPVSDLRASPNPQDEERLARRGAPAPRTPATPQEAVLQLMETAVGLTRHPDPAVRRWAIRVPPLVDAPVPDIIRLGSWLHSVHAMATSGPRALDANVGAHMDAWNEVVLAGTHAMVMAAAQVASDAGVRGAIPGAARLFRTPGWTDQVARILRGWWMVTQPRSAARLTVQQAAQDVRVAMQVMGSWTGPHDFMGWDTAPNPQDEERLARRAGQEDPVAALDEWVRARTPAGQEELLVGLAHDVRRMETTRMAWGGRWPFGTAWTCDRGSSGRWIRWVGMAARVDDQVLVMATSLPTGLNMATDGDAIQWASEYALRHPASPTFDQSVVSLAKDVPAGRGLITDRIRRHGWVLPASMRLVPLDVASRWASSRLAPRANPQDEERLARRGASPPPDAPVSVWAAVAWDPGTNFTAWGVARTSTDAMARRDADVHEWGDRMAARRAIRVVGPKWLPAGTDQVWVTLSMTDRNAPRLDISDTKPAAMGNLPAGPYVHGPFDVDTGFLDQFPPRREDPWAHRSHAPACDQPCPACGGQTLHHEADTHYCTSCDDQDRRPAGCQFRGWVDPDGNVTEDPA